MSATIKRILIWSVVAWICAVSVLAIFATWADGPSLTLFVPLLASPVIGFVWIGGEASKIGSWPAFCGWAFMAWEVLAILVAMVLS